MCTRIYVALGYVDSYGPRLHGWIDHYPPLNVLISLKKSGCVRNNQNIQTQYSNQSIAMDQGNFMATTIRSVTIRSQKQEQFKELKKKSTKDFAPFCTSRFCSCVTRRHLIQGFGSLLLPIGPSIASDLPPNDPLV
ncbi:hypothetical protein M9H77_09953 [Catharanthus roseus]|uniref:Uncharacterized protein n=1 Tax=Catharanthus roseus TaxID=4058 RepID=A0ACC0C2M2_CATRO|nr:hypothetical protein M9H77_09953 [Catharanthus roseus]